MASSELTNEEVEPHEHVEADEDPGMPAADIDATFVARPRGNIAGVELDGESVLLVEGSTRPHWLNQTGTVVWKCLDGSVTLGELSVELAEAFGADPDVVQSDVLTLVQEIGKAGLLEGVAEELPPVATQYVPPEGLPLGSDAPSFAAEDRGGKQIALEDLRGRRLLLVNWSPVCGYCKKIMPDFAEVQPDFREQGIELVLLAVGEKEINLEVLAEGELDCTLLLQDGSAELFAGLGTPSAYLLDEEGKIASDLTVGAIDVPVLARTAAGRDEEPSE